MKPKLRFEVFFVFIKLFLFIHNSHLRSNNLYLILISLYDVIKRGIFVISIRIYKVWTKSSNQSSKTELIGWKKITFQYVAYLGIQKLTRVKKRYVCMFTKKRNTLGYTKIHYPYDKVRFYYRLGPRGYMTQPSNDSSFFVI
jgi:hypothetical protein